MFIEHQANRSTATARRLFLYAAWLMDRYHSPVYPVLVTSYDQPRTPEPNHFQMDALGLRVINFRFRVVQLNRLNWRNYTRLNNPLTTALMAKMNIAPTDRPKVKVQILRLLATMRLEPDKMDLIAGFMDTYLRFAAKEELAFQRELDKLENSEEKTAAMELMTLWERKGRREGQLDLLKLLLEQRVGNLSAAALKRINSLTSEDLSRLAKALLGFKSPADLDRWLSRI